MGSYFKDPIKSLRWKRVVWKTTASRWQWVNTAVHFSHPNSQYISSWGSSCLLRSFGGRYIWSLPLVVAQSRELLSYWRITYPGTSSHIILVRFLGFYDVFQGWWDMVLHGSLSVGKWWDHCATNASSWLLGNAFLSQVLVIMEGKGIASFPQSLNFTRLHLYFMWKILMNGWTVFGSFLFMG